MSEMCFIASLRVTLAEIETKTLLTLFLCDAKLGGGYARHQCMRSQGFLEVAVRHKVLLGVFKRETPRAQQCLLAQITEVLQRNKFRQVQASIQTGLDNEFDFLLDRDTVGFCLQPLQTF